MYFQLYPQLESSMVVTMLAKNREDEYVLQVNTVQIIIPNGGGGGGSGRGPKGPQS